MPPPLFLIVEGSIGAGKSTMLEQLSRILTMEYKMKTIIIPEPVDVWEATGALAHFYKDTQANGYQFQTFVYSTRVIRINEYVKKYSDADIYLIERSVISDKYLFVKLLQESGGFTPLQTVMYEQWVTMWDGLLPSRLLMVLFTWHQVWTRRCDVSRFVDEVENMSRVTIKRNYIVNTKNYLVSYINRPTPRSR